MKTANWKRTIALPVAVAVALSGCGGGGSNSKPRVEPRTLYGNVKGINNNPRSGTGLDGRVKAQVSDARSPVIFTLDINRFYTNSQVGNADITRVTVNLASPLDVYPPITGPALFTLYQKPSGAATPFPATFSRSVSAADLTPNSFQGVSTYADAVKAIREGRTLLQVYTTANPDGEVRGFIGQDQLIAGLFGEFEIEPPVSTNLRIRADVRLNAAQRRVFVTITNEGTQPLTDVTGIEIHFGKAREEGTTAPIVFRISGSVANAFPQTFTKELTAADFIAAPQRGLRTFDDFAAQLPTAGNQIGSDDVGVPAAFINVRTRRYPQGELRGTIFQDSSAGELARASLKQKSSFGPRQR